VIEKLLEPGVDVFRLNASHGTREEHPATIRTECQIARRWGRDAAILPGFEGRKIYLGRFHAGGCVLAEGQRSALTERAAAGRLRASVDHPQLAQGATRVTVRHWLVGQ